MVMLSALDYTWDEMVDVLKIEDLLTPGSRIFFQTHLFPLIKMQGSAKELFLTFGTKDKSRLPILLNVLVENRGDTFEVHCAGMEISNRNQFEKELFEAKNIAEKALLENKDLIHVKKELEKNQHLLEKQLQHISRYNYEHTQISKVLAHDMQEPLRKIVLFISLIDQQLEPGHPARTNFQKIKNFTTRVRKLIHSMQRFNSLDYKEMEQNEIDLNLVLNIAKNNAGCSGVKVVLSGADEVNLSGDVELITNLFEELFVNSAKFRHDARPLEIKIAADVVLNNIFKHTDNRYKYENFVRIRYSDNGMGFDNNYSRQIFELFKKLHPNDGLGIGLAYCKKIIDMHHGSITVHSAQTGTNFTILLPLTAVQSPAEVTIEQL